MTIKKITPGQDEHRTNRLTVLGLKVTDGHTTFNLDGVWLHAKPSTGSETRDLKAKQSYSIKLPHVIKVNPNRSAVLVSINPEVADKLESYSIPTLLGPGFEGQLTVNVKAKSDVSFNELVKLSVIPVEF